MSLVAEKGSGAQQPQIWKRCKVRKTQDVVHSNLISQGTTSFGHGDDKSSQEDYSARTSMTLPVTLLQQPQRSPLPSALSCQRSGETDRVVRSREEERSRGGYDFPVQVGLQGFRMCTVGFDCVALVTCYNNKKVMCRFKDSGVS